MQVLPPVANTGKVSIQWVLDLNTTAESILYFNYSGGPPSTANCQGLAAGVQAAAVVRFKPLLQAVNKIGLVTFQDIASSSGNEGQGGSTTGGTRTGNSNPASTCIVMNHSIAQRYRGGKPRTYAPFGVDADQNTTGTWTSAFVGTCNTAWANFITDCLAVSSGPNSLTQYIAVSYYHDDALRATPVQYPITQTLGRTRIGTQRRRLRTA